MVCKGVRMCPLGEWERGRCAAVQGPGSVPSFLLMCCWRRAPPLPSTVFFLGACCLILWSWCGCWWMNGSVCTRATLSDWKLLPTRLSNRRLEEAVLSLWRKELCGEGSEGRAIVDATFGYDWDIVEAIMPGLRHLWCRVETLMWRLSLWNERNVWIYLGASKLALICFVIAFGVQCHALYSLGHK